MDNRFEYLLHLHKISLKGLMQIGHRVCGEEGRWRLEDRSGRELFSTCLFVP